ncbi:aconitate hydratase AcnA [Limibacillus halophilus]|uniref:Aconitate hydratase n=1 Tax=Limibacillus halophilus TaxID=1579333 RepID=A0A839SMG8_9PROT|nr:aconitate hydratase AcnA [Limibacillus halophilus]MBB3064021.1 aconitate hydratase [Limibacillus halophilus]
MKLGQDSLKTRRNLSVEGQSYEYYSLPAAAEAGLGDLSRLPYSLKVLLENLLRFEDGDSVSVDDIKALAARVQGGSPDDREIAYRPARVLMQDFTGVPAVVDLAAMREAMVGLGGDPRKINPLSPVDLVIDHSVMVDYFGGAGAFEKNVEREFERNQERYAFLRWGQKAFDNFSVVPPGTGICHQVNLEYIAQAVWTSKIDGKNIAYPDTLVGTDSHTTMVNGLGVLGWGVGGIEAEAAMLGQPVTMLIPDVVGFKLSGELKEGTTATDLVLTCTEMLRKKGVVGKFVEFYGPGLKHLTLADRATLGNMSPEFGSTCAIFPIDAETLRYLDFTGRDKARVKLVEAYAKAQGMWHDESTPDPVFSDSLSLDISTVEPALAGPKRPQDRIALSAASGAFSRYVAKDRGVDPVGAQGTFAAESPSAAEHSADGFWRSSAVADEAYTLDDGAVVIAAITSCTNTSNPSVMVGAGLLARKALAKGLQVKPWVKTSLAPGSQVVSDYLEKAGLQTDLDGLGFNLVGYGCTTCIGNSGPLPEKISAAVEAGDLTVCSVLSGNRNFEGRINPHCRANYLASPPLVVAYALAGSMKADLLNDPLGTDKEGNPVFLKDIWPSNKEIHETMEKSLSREMFESRYANVYEGPEQWRSIATSTGETFDWDPGSTYVAYPPFFEGMGADPDPIQDIKGARPLAILGDSVTTDHISPAGSIKKDGPTGEYLLANQVRPAEFNSYGARRGNHEVMMRGTFANIRIRNEMVPGVEGGYTMYVPTGEQRAIYDAAMDYAQEGTPLVIVAGQEYGTGSSRDWAAKGTRLLGVKAVIAESFERIHRSNLVGMGVLPLQFKEGQNRHTLKLTGEETFDFTGIEGGITPRQDIACTLHRPDGSKEEVVFTCRIDTAGEVEYYANGGILHYVLRNLAKSA